MTKLKFRPFWSYDVIKTQDWLDMQCEKGYHFVSFNPAFRTFNFNKADAINKKHVIIYDKSNDGCPAYVSKNNDYNEIYQTKNYCILEQTKEEPEYFSSYDQLLSRNQQIKFIVGIILLIQVILNILPLALVLVSATTGNMTVEYEPGGITAPTNIGELLEGIFVLMFMIIGIIVQLWLVYTYFKLRKSNKKLEKISVEDINLSFTIPTDTIISKEEMKQLKLDKKLVKKRKLGWFYSPDIHEEWLEEMELKGFNLIRMSKIGNSFYFVKGETRKMKYHVDYQLRKNPSYFKINEESGWKLYFTSLTRFFAISVWGQEYTEIKPEYYSDPESKVKHAKRFMLSYIVWFLPMSLMYFVMSGFSIYAYVTIDFFRDNFWLYLTPLMFIIAGIEFLYFSFRLIRYYNRVKENY